MSGSQRACSVCGPDISVTLPNHVGMVTGRLAAGPAGHGWVKNEDPPARAHGGTLHAKSGAYMAGMFDVAHDHGLRTALICGKWKFALFEQSYGEDAGGPDTVAPDNGRDKIDLFACNPDPDAIADLGASALRMAAEHGQRSLTMLHFPNTDFAGHLKGWDLAEGSEYRKAAASIDRALQRLLSVIDSDERLRGHVAIVLTADHGGGVPLISHTDVEAPVNFTIPFLVWMGSDREPVDLYAMNAGRRGRPAPSERFAAGGPPPIRNAEAGNTALQVLGLPAIPGSAANALQDLRLVDAPRADAVGH
jgi:hypothetical protein